MTASSATRRKPRAWGLPLLMKELAEQSSRKRTYVIRTVYALLLFAFTTLIFWAEVYGEINSPFEILGRGRQMFLVVLAMQFGGVYLFMPAITCGVITAEKERNTIGLLLLTKLGPWTILLEKLMGRLVPMGTFLLLSLPLMGFSYALGGVSQSELWIGVWALAITVLQVGALAVACSAFFRTTVQAFIATYLFGILMYFGPIFLVEMSWIYSEVAERLAEGYNNIVNFAATFVVAFLSSYGFFGGALPGSVIEPLNLNEWDFPGIFFTPVMLIERWNMPLWHVIPRSLPTLVSIVFFLLTARLFVVRRAYAQPRNHVLKVFKRLDGVFYRINNNRLTRGIVLVDDVSSLPDDEPIAWRETKKKSLGTVRYLVRIFVATEIPVLVVCLLLAIDNYGYDRSFGNEAVTALLFCGWPMVALLVCVKAATLISGERSHETLDVLLSTPIRSAEVIRQKFRGVRRLMLVLALPLLTIVLFQTYWRSPTLSLRDLFDDQGPLLYFMTATLSIVIYLPLVAWTSFFIGLRVRSQSRAIFTALAVLVGWCAIPVIITGSIIEIFDFGRHTPLRYFFLYSPATVIALAEYSDLDEINNTPWLAAIVNFLFYGTIVVVVRAMSLHWAARYLGRAETAASVARSDDDRERAPLRVAAKR